MGEGKRSGDGEGRGIGMGREGERGEVKGPRCGCRVEEAREERNAVATRGESFREITLVRKTV